MPVAEAVQSFAGIANENEFYGHHYLAEVFKGDIRALIETWQAAEDAAEEKSADSRAPHRRLGGLGSKWFAALAGHQRLRDDAERLKAHAQLHAPLFEALGYTLKAQTLELQAGMPIPVWASYGEAHKAPQLVIVPAYQPGREDDDPLEHALSSAHYTANHDVAEVPKSLKGLTWLEIVSEALLGTDAPPRYVILIGYKEWLLLDRYKWPNNRLLRFDWSEILDRKDNLTLQATAALLHRDSLAPQTGASLLDGLDENAHKHAYGVSEDLKYALREAIELLGNEAVRQLRQKAQDAKQGFYSGKDAVDAGELSLEALRMVYRLLFMFYIEARPELGYVPIQKSEIYAKGYSLESLRDLELTALNTPAARDGRYFDATLRRLFSLIAQGCGITSQPHLIAGSVKEAFALAPLDSKLFDPDATPLLNQVVFPNHVWQRVIRLMSLSGGKGKKKGRVSYQLLSINQLGAVYEALLSYRGFFAQEDLYEVQPKPKKAASSTSEDEDDDDGSDGDEPAAGTGGGSTDMLDSAWFVPASRIHEYEPAERVHDVDEHGHKVLRKYPRDTFIYRLAGRDRQKSASYYTPQVLTRCLVKYALKELLADKTADDILKLKVVEPAMGSAAFLNEAVSQLAEAYLERKQLELGRRIPHDTYATELQKVRMYLADRNVFGVDLNPVATELAEVSLWLNAIYGEEGSDGQPPRAARVPWFGYQLFCGNSLIGARREVYRATSLRPRAKPAWFDEPPRRLDPQSLASRPASAGDAASPDALRLAKASPADAVLAAEPGHRAPDEIYHFLLPDPSMADYGDKVAKALYPEDFARLKDWRKAFCKPLEDHELCRLQQLSAAIDRLWGEHTRQLAEDRARTEDPLPVWPASVEAGESPPSCSSRAHKEAIRKQGLLNEDGQLATPYRRLKLVMDYWCALWFWPITQSATLPSREQWWMEVGAILEGNIIDLTPQGGLDFSAPAEPQVLLPEVAPDLFGAVQPELSVPAQGPNLHDKYGQLRISKLREHFPRIRHVEAIVRERRFMHWELAFADVFARQGGFDLVLGNPPWLKVEWQEAGVLGEANPMFAIRKLSASELAKLRAEAFDALPGLQAAWTTELEEAEATQAFLNAVQNYPLLKGVQTNLYKCFLPVGWKLAGERGVSAYLHPEGTYDDPKGGGLREAVYTRLREHFQFSNEAHLFAEVHNRTRFGINIYGATTHSPRFDHIANLFIPTTVDAIYAHDGSGTIGGFKNEKDEWNVSGHKDRVVTVDNEALKVFADLYDEPGTPSFRARLPALHARQFESVLAKIASYPRRLIDLGAECTSTEMWHETMQQKDGTIVRRPPDSDGFASTPSDWIVSGPHFYLANPINKTPRKICTANKHYDIIDLEKIPDDYLPRTNYVPMANRDEYLRRTPPIISLSSDGSAPRPITDFFRLTFRNMFQPSNERALLCAITPTGHAHVHSVISSAFLDHGALAAAAVVCQSIIGDFFIKTSGRTGLYSTWLKPCRYTQLRPPHRVAPVWWRRHP
ncbi:N6 adenine-specific DNA methyltransferase [Aromatoleum aromaticum EbN1]|uniref:site-specific DNA-methyltransferase (adenine-specific) n=1 Tax=Aromatoleum aromaticum (strain DSM 19018 / LMG 30748 / EbN1) TaxID=76114 RepID=Q5P8V2_AROAE|nr:class I SAM-dependent DNA methyltransferase [Aromatoleum aromaticum]CAI06257.1 N6 adenine-specific DNA methyltransferase [Aromatoleum aromaticum EbN1]